MMQDVQWKWGDTHRSLVHNLTTAHAMSNTSEAPSPIATAAAETNVTEFQWTTATIIQSIVLFFLAGVAEIVGGWMIWMTIRGNDKQGKRPWWFAVLGGCTLVLYGFIPCFQPTSNFGRLYAAYGGAFIVMSFLFGWALDGNIPDIGDVVGGVISISGAAVIYFWPR